MYSSLEERFLAAAELMGRALQGKKARARLMTELAKTWFVQPSSPIRLILAVTRRCNMRCWMCRSWSLDGGHEMSPSEVGALVSQMPHLVSLDITGGEPFVRPDIIDVLEAVLGAAPRLSMLHFTTNGWHVTRVLDGARAAHAVRPEIELMPTVSVDGPPDVHDALRGREGSFEHAMETLRELGRMPGISPVVGTTITPRNAHHMEQLAAVLENRLPGFKPARWHWNALQTSPHFFGNTDLAAHVMDIPEGLLVRHLHRRGLPRSLMDLLESFFLLNLEMVRRGEPAGMPCQALRSTAFVSAEGTLYPCHLFDRPIGDVRCGLPALWRSRAARVSRRQVRRLDCGGCFTPCEAYPMMAGSPLTATRITARRALRLAREGVRRRPSAGRPSADGREEEASAKKFASARECDEAGSRQTTSPGGKSSDS